MVITLLQFTLTTLALMRSGKLYEICNKNGDVLKTTALVASRLFVCFAQRYIAQGMTVSAVGSQTEIIERTINQYGVKKFVELYGVSFTSDSEAADIIRYALECADDQLDPMPHSSQQIKKKRLKYVDAQEESKQQESFHKTQDFVEEFSAI